MQVPIILCEFYVIHSLKKLELKHGVRSGLADKELARTNNMANNMIPAPEGMQMSRDLAKNWEVFHAEFEDFVLAAGLNEKSEEVQAASLRRLMGNECRHIYTHNVILDEEQKKDPAAILDALGEYFMPAKSSDAANRRLMNR